MKYRIQSTGDIKTQGEVRKMFPNTSLPRVWDKDLCASLNIDPILESPKPTAGSLEVVVADGVIQDSLGNWVEKWVVRSMFNTYTNEEGVVVTKEEQEASYIASETAKKAEAVRNERDSLLSQSDWMVVKAAETGVAMDSTWTAYRQALRDVTAQEGFPNNVTWPVAP